MPSVLCSNGAVADRPLSHIRRAERVRLEPCQRGMQTSSCETGATIRYGDNNKQASKHPCRAAWGERADKCYDPLIHVMQAGKRQLATYLSDLPCAVLSIGQAASSHKTTCRHRQTLALGAASSKLVPRQDKVTLRAPVGWADRPAPVLSDSLHL